MLRGNAPAKIDDRGRLKVPAGFRSLILADHGRDLFVTSIHGQSALIYPMAVWTEIEANLAKMSSLHPSRRRFLDRVNFYGQVSEFDPQGRVVIPQRLRESAQINGEVDVLGHENYLEVWNHDRFKARLIEDQFTDEDARALAEFGI